MHADSLEADLRDHLFWWLSQYPGPERRRHRWVMDISWCNACRQLAPMDGPLFWASPQRLAQPELLLGLPIDIRDHDDRPGWLWRVPHLENAV